MNQRLKLIGAAIVALRASLFVAGNPGRVSVALGR
jgi:hypothetical protein